MCSFLFIFFSCFEYLKTISTVVGDRETKNLESMESMGMERSTYIKVLFTWIVIKQSIYSCFITIFMKVFIIPYINFFFIFSIYFLFSLNLLMIATTISCFFKELKKALISGIIIFFTLCIPLIICRKFGDSEFIINIFASSPLSSMGMVF